MRKEEAFEFLCRLAQGIASMFGDSCETVVHEMEGERMKNLVIFNGHVSGRSAGSTLSIYGRDTIQDDPEGTSLDQDFLNQMVVTPSGKNIKSSTCLLYTSRGPVIDSKASVERIDPSVLILIHKRSFLPLSFHVGCGVFQRAYLWTQSHAHRLFVDLLTGR